MACRDCLAGQPAFCEIAARLGIAPVVLLARVATMLDALAGDAATLLGTAVPPVASPRKAPDSGAVRTRRWRATRLAAMTGNALAGEAVTARDVTTSPNVTHEANQRVGPSPGVTSLKEDLGSIKHILRNSLKKMPLGDVTLAPVGGGTAAKQAARQRWFQLDMAPWMRRQMSADLANQLIGAWWEAEIERVEAEARFEAEGRGEVWRKNPVQCEVDRLDRIRKGKAAPTPAREREMFLPRVIERQEGPPLLPYDLLPERRRAMIG